MQPTTVLIFLVTIVPCLCQRSFYAGHHAIGIPDVSPPAVQGTGHFRPDLPAALNGDVAAANRLDQLPEDQRPIWYLNQKQYEDQLHNPKTYPQRGSIFNEYSG